MTEELLNFELVSPEKIALSKRVHMAVMPGDDGCFGVLLNHVPMIKKLGPGVVLLYSDPNTITEKAFITGGFAEISGKKCTLLVDSSCDLDKLPTAKDINAEIQTLEEQHNATANEKTRLTFLTPLKIARAKRDAVEGL